MKKKGEERGKRKEEEEISSHPPSFAAISTASAVTNIQTRKGAAEWGDGVIERSVGTGWRGS